MLQQDLSMKGEDVAHFAFSNELKIAFIVYKDNTLEINTISYNNKNKNKKLYKCQPSFNSPQ